METYLEEWLHSFQEEIWKTRCKEITNWEKEKGITNKRKRNKPSRKIEKYTLPLTEQILTGKEVNFSAQELAFREIEIWIRTGYSKSWLMY